MEVAAERADEGSEGSVEYSGAWKHLVVDRDVAWGDHQGLLLVQKLAVACLVAERAFAAAAAAASTVVARGVAAPCCHSLALLS